MPIDRIPYPNAVPTAVSDYERQNDLIETSFLSLQDPWPVVGGNIVEGAIFQVGGTVYLCTAATAIGGVASDYVKLTPIGAGAQLQADYVANLAGVSWDEAYNGYYDVGGNLYIFDEAIAIEAGEIAQAYTKTGQQIQNVLNENLTVNGLKTFSEEATFQDSINTNDLEFASVSTGSQVINAGANWTPTRGFYMFASNNNGNNIQIRILVGGSWYVTGTTNGLGFAYCDGVNVRIQSTDAGAITLRYLKWST